MADAPERIWIDNCRQTPEGLVCGGGEHPHVNGGVQYVRADVAEAEKQLAVAAALDRALAKAVRPYRIALADAIRRPMGVVPASAEGLVTTAELGAAEDRRVQDARDKAAAIRAQGD